MKPSNLLLFVILYAAGLFLSLNMNSKYKVFTYKSAMWADASGYYVYLPSTFIYHWDAKKMPDGIDTLTGEGFFLRQNKSLIFTKYTSGQSYLHLPFFLAAHLYCKLTTQTADGFSQPYVNSLIFAGVFYMLAALFILYFVLSKYYTKKVCLATVVSLFLCTNLYYYSIKHPGLSHIYTFFIASVLMYLVQRFSARKLLLIIPLSALIMLIRPTNITLLGIIVLFGLAVHGNEVLKKVQLKYYFFGLIFSFLICLPQLFYWHYVSGHWLMYSYENEGFIFWKNPRYLEVLIAPRNGFFLYSPIMIFAILGFIFKPVNKKFSIAVILLFFFITYVHASWHSPGFGCACGGRSYIDFFPVFVLGLAAFFDFIARQNKIRLTGFTILLLIFAAYNLLFIYRYDDCWHAGTWDYSRIIFILKDQLPQ